MQPDESDDARLNDDESSDDDGVSADARLTLSPPTSAPRPPIDPFKPRFDSVQPVFEGDDLSYESLDGVGEDSITQKVSARVQEVVKDRATLTVLTGRSAGRIMGLYKASCILGRGKEADIQLHDATVSRQHARIQHWVSKAFVVIDLASSNGTYVNGHVIERAALKSGDRLQLGNSTILRFSLVDQIESKLQRHLYAAQARDADTQVFDRKHLLGQLRLEVAHSRRHNTNVCLLLIQIDDFETHQDELSAAGLSSLLQSVASRVSECGRIEDLVARFAAGTFAMLLRTTDLDDAVVVARRVQSKVADTATPADDEVPPVTASVGAAALSELPLYSGSPELLELTRERLQRATKQHRGGLCYQTPPRG